MSETDSSCLNCGAALPPIKTEEDYDKDFEKKEKINKNLIGDMYFFVILFVLFTICALFNFDFLYNNLISYLIWIVITVLAVLCIIKAKKFDKSAGYYSLIITFLFIPEAITLSGLAVLIVILCGYHTFKFFDAYK